MPQLLDPSVEIDTAVGDGDELSFGDAIRLLDELSLGWEYQPITFTIRQLDTDQTVSVRMITPDFFLPEFNQFLLLPHENFCDRSLEKQIKVLQKQYPDVEIDLFSSATVKNLARSRRTRFTELSTL